MTQPNLATAFAVGSRPQPKEQPRLKLVIRASRPDESSTQQEEHWFADNVDTFVLVLAVAAGIFGYTAFGILAVAGR
ncbi:MAG: hypothetical protein ABSD20_13985 [Terriglobales bacterium]|jgi:hypothetical protein